MPQCMERLRLDDSVLLIATRRGNERLGMTKGPADPAAPFSFGLRYLPIDWRALRDSNPCYRRERAVSWTARRRARTTRKRRRGKGATYKVDWRQRQATSAPPPAHQCPVLGMDFQGSLGGNAAPFCNSSIDWLSGERTNAIMPSRGGRLIVTPDCMSFSQVA